MGSQPDQNKPETFVMVDVESSGRIPGDYSMLSIGAVIVGQHTPPYHRGFYLELKPLEGSKVEPEAMAVNGLDFEKLKETGTDPFKAMTYLRQWVIHHVNPEVVRPVMVSNGTFDYMWVMWYFEHFGVRNPFGPNSLDMKSLYFGQENQGGRMCRWGQTTSRSIFAKHPEWHDGSKSTHNALDDAMRQAEWFSRMMSR